MNRKLIEIGCICIVTSILIASTSTVEEILCVLQYALLSYGIVLVTYGFLHERVKRKVSIFYYISLILMVFYAILLLDTFVFHALTWFPGILRYALFSTYGFFYLLFIIVGLGFCHKNK